MRKTRIITLVLAVFCGFYITVNFFWLKVSVNTPPWDEATHAYIISVFSKYLDGHTLWSLLLNKDILLIDTRYPKFMHLVIATLNSPFPVKNIGSMVLIMDLVFLPILVFSVFAIGRRMCNEKAGFLAAFLVAIYPFSIAASRHISLDFPLISWAALMIYAFILSDDFRRPIFSIFFGVTLGLGLLIKQSFIFFVIPVIVYFLARVFSEKQEKALILRQVYNLCASLFPCLLICGWWYFYSFTNTHGGDNLSVHYYKLFNPLHRFLHWRGSVKYYPQVLIYQISWPLSIIFMLSLLPYIESSLKYKYLPVIFIFFSLFMYSFF